MTVGEELVLQWRQQEADIRNEIMEEKRATNEKTPLFESEIEGLKLASYHLKENNETLKEDNEKLKNQH